METRSLRRRTPGRSRRCESCQRLFAKAITIDDAELRVSPCRFCGHGGEDRRTSQPFITVHLRLVFDGMPPSELRRVEAAVRSADPRSLAGLRSAVAPISPPLASWMGLHDDGDAADVRATVLIVTGVLQALISTLRARPSAEQVDDIVVHVVEGRLDRLPLPATGPCFCARGQRYADCHGRRTA